MNNEHRVFDITGEALESNAVPDDIQQTGCDALTPGQAEDPDPADPAQSLFWDGGAAPGSVSLHEVILGHIFVPIRLLENPVSLRRKTVEWSHLWGCFSLKVTQKCTYR